MGRRTSSAAITAVFTAPAADFQVPRPQSGIFAPVWRVTQSPILKVLCDKGRGMGPRAKKFDNYLFRRNGGPSVHDWGLALLAGGQ